MLQKRLQLFFFENYPAYLDRARPYRLVRKRQISGNSTTSSILRR